MAEPDISSEPALARTGPLFWFSSLCLRHRAATLGLTAVVTVFLGAVVAGIVPRPVARGLGIPASGIEIDASTRAFVIKNDPDKEYYDRYLERFGSDTMLVIGTECPHSYFAEAELRRTLALSRRIKDLEHVKRVSSLATVPYVTADGHLAFLDDLLASGRVSPAALDRFAEQMSGNRIVADNLISKDERTSMIYVYFADGLDEEQIVASGVLDNVRRIVGEEAGNECTTYLVGNPVLRESLSRIIKSDLFLFVGGTQILAALAVFGIFRTLRTVGIIMVFVWVTLAWTFGVFVIAGQKLNLTTAMLTPVLITVCVAIAVHIFVHFSEERLHGRDGRDAVLTTVRRMGKPCFLTSLTTAIGLGSLVVNRIGPVRSFGVFGALGTMLSFVLVFALLPIVLSGSPSSAPGPAGRRDRHPVLRMLGRFSRVCVTHPWTTLIVAGIVALGAVYGITRLAVETRIISYFKAREPIVKAYRTFDEKHLGITSLQVMVTSPSADILSPEIQSQVETFAEHMRDQPHVASVTCCPDYVRERDRVLAELRRGGRLPWRELLDAANEATEVMSTFVSKDRTSTRITIRLFDVTSKVLLDTVRTIGDEQSEFFDDTLDVRITGGTKLYTNIVGTLVSGQIRSIVLAFVAITVVMAVVFRSLKIGLISMVPTTLPVLITLGMMGWIGVALNGATVMIASVAIGIVVDSAIHFLHRYRREYMAAHDFQTAISRTLLTVGQPISYAVLILSCAFVILALGKFNPTNYFGIMTAFTMLISLVITLLLLPVCLNLFHFRFEKNNRERSEPREGSDEVVAP